MEVKLFMKFETQHICNILQIIFIRFLILHIYLIIFDNLNLLYFIVYLYVKFTQQKRRKRFKTKEDLNT